MKRGRSFFIRDTNIVAKELLGRVLVRVLPNGKKLKAIITETEAYHGFDDEASHASKKKTERNKVMFEKGGLLYVYLVYGMYWCLNIVTMEKDFPAAVLIRSMMVCPAVGDAHVRPLQIAGPGRVCKMLEIDKTFYGEDITKSKRIWVEKGTNIKKRDIIASKRVGVDYAEECADWEWNYRVNLLEKK